MGVRLQEALATAFAAPAADHVELARVAWPVLARPDMDPLFSLFFESNGLAAAGREPYRTLTAQLVGLWATWLAGFFDGTEADRRIEAEATIALVDGLLLLRQVSGAAAANRAATRLGIR